jgi:hypothetical protein
MRRIAFALVAIGAALVAVPTGADAASTVKSGWWYRASDPDSAIPQAAQPPVPVPDAPVAPPAPPTVAEGHLLVEGTLEGATAVAAITYSLSEGETSPVLTIMPSESSGVPPEAVILACRAAVDWTAPEANPGRWQDKPLVDCGRSVNGIIGEDGTITFALQPLVSGTEADIVLVPGVVSETPAGRVGSAFSLSFDAAAGAVIQSSGGSSTATTAFSAPTSPTGSGSSFTAPSGGGSFSAPSAPVVQPALEPQEQAPVVPSQPQLAAKPAVAEDDTAQAVGFIIMVIGALLAGLAYLTPARAETGTVGLGRFRKPVPADATVVEPVEGGLGRFARPRVGAPPSLS